MFSTPHLFSLTVAGSPPKTNASLPGHVMSRPWPRKRAKQAWTTRESRRKNQTSLRHTNVSQATKCQCVNQTSKRVKESQRSVCACFAVCSCLCLSIVQLQTFLHRGLLRPILSKTVCLAVCLSVSPPCVPLPVAFRLASPCFYAFVI